MVSLVSRIFNDFELVEKTLQWVLSVNLLTMLAPLRGHATNSYAKILLLIFYYYFSFLFESDVFMVLENHHLRLEILTLRLRVEFLAKSMVNPYILDLVSEFWFYTFKLCHLVPKLIYNENMEVVF